MANDANGALAIGAGNLVCGYGVWRYEGIVVGVV
jgi:hypothetical protein